MTLGPIEIVVIAFPRSSFNGQIVPELQRLVEKDVVTIIDGLIVHIEDDGSATFVELDEASDDVEVAELANVLSRVDGLLSDDDVAELTSDLEPGSTAAILVFEHTWVKPLRDAIVDSGGIMLESVRVPGAVASEVLEALSDAV